MKQEDKELLLKDLCARLPYHLILHFDEKVQEDDEYLYGFRENGGKFLINDAYYIEEVKPYLRSVDTITKEEETTLPKRWRKLLYEINEKPDDMLNKFLGINHYNASDLLDWMNSHYIDYRNLIDKDLALELFILGL